ncbi:MAG: plasmid mobilization relaxosome protein MobC [Erysipelotrichia bacterium]|nr:plasmid mobilization relaxosome protein MobC [Erysipelotrichia bacterium]
MIYEINRIGNNLNQVAYRANSSKNIDQHAFITMYDSYMQLLSAYDNFVRENFDKCRA